MTAYYKRVLRHFAVLYLPLCLVVLAGGWAYLHFSANAALEAVKARESARVNREAQVMMTAFAARAADAAFLAARISDELGQDGAADPERIARLLKSFADVKRAFLQVRFLNAAGQEVVRINRDPGGPVRVSDDLLQDKSKTAYFKDGATLPMGHVAVSRFDLNVERGEIEAPLTPVVRFESPVQGPGGAFAGLVVLNLDGQVPLDRLRQAAVAALGRPLLANSQGYWLLGPDADQEWGFQIASRSNQTLEAAWPGVWKIIAAGERGQFVHDGALYTFDTVNAESQGGMQSAVDLHAAENWKIVARVSPGRLTPPQATTFSVMTGGLLALFAALSWLWASGRTRRDMIQAELAESAEQFRAMSEATQDALVMTDDAGLVVFLNDAAERMFALSRHEIVGRMLHEFVTRPGELGKAREGLPGFAKTGQGAVINALHEYEACRGDGTVFPVELSVAAFRRAGRWWAVGTARDISERKRAEEALRQLAATDGLTGLFNRRRFLEMGTAELERARRFGHPVSLIMFDVDHFKKVNDTRGHDAGDAVLVALARTARDALRGVDILGRLGGEEFAVVLPETGIDAAVEVAGRLRLAVAGMDVVLGGAPLPVTISLGVVQGRAPGENLDEFLKRADEAMYRAKTSGRNRVERG